MLLSRVFAICLLVLSFTPSAFAADPLWLRDPAISPDGSRIAFRYLAQIWTVPAAGGQAIPLTPAGFRATNPVWSPDGATIAFSANRYGPANVFSAPAAGGEATRLTWYAGTEIPTGFTPDGRSVLFTSTRLGDATGTFAAAGIGEYLNQLYQVPLDDAGGGARETMVLANAAMDAHWNADATALLYTSPGVEQRMRQHQVSDTVRQVWRFDPATGTHTPLTTGREENREAVWAPDGSVLFLSGRSGSLNVWRMSADGAAPQQVTHMTGEPVRTLSVARNGDIVFSQAGLLWRLQPGQAEPQQVDVQIGAAGFPGRSDARSSSFSDFAISPNGREVALVAQGDLYIATVDGRTTRRLTRTPGEERSPVFTPDGRTLIYTAERGDHWALFEQSLATGDTSFFDAGPLTETLLRSGPDDPMLPTVSPDGKLLAFVTNREAVQVRSLADGSEVTVLPKGSVYAYNDDEWWLSWSPDSKWLALPVEPSQIIDNIAIVPADGHLPALRVAPSGENQDMATWSVDGGVLSWLADADELRDANGSEYRADLQAVFTSRAARDAFRQRLRVPLSPDGSPLPAAAQVSGPAPTASSGPVEPDGFDTRRLPLPSQPGSLLFGALLPDGVSTLAVERTPTPDGHGRQLSGLVYDTRQARRRVMFSGLPYAGGPVRATADLSKLYFLGPSGLVEVDTARNSSRMINVSVEVSHDDAAVRKAAFEQFWTLTERKFYDPTFPGVDWEAMRRRMEQRLPSLGDTEDLAELLSEMAGALNASHTGSFIRRGIVGQEAGAGLGLYYDERYPGPGMKVTAILSGGPFDAAGTQLRPGDLILAIDGEDIPARGGISRALRGKAGLATSVTFLHPDPAIPNPVRITERRAPITLSQQQDLARHRWVRHNQDVVAEASCGKIGYVFLPAMNQQAYRDAFSDIFGRYQNAAGLVVDIRFNGGGDLHNNLITLLSGHEYSSFTPERGGPSQREPRDRWAGRSVVLMNGASYSDASVFPFAYRALGLGRLVGTTTAGTGTFVWWVGSNLIPGLTYGLPELPYRALDGTLLENHDIKPDIAVPNDPQAWNEGQDPQLMAALKSLQPEPCGK